MLYQITKIVLGQVQPDPMNPAKQNVGKFYATFESEPYIASQQVNGVMVMSLTSDSSSHKETLFLTDSMAEFWKAKIQEGGGTGNVRSLNIIVNKERIKMELPEAYYWKKFDNAQMAFVDEPAVDNNGQYRRFTSYTVTVNVSPDGKSYIDNPEAVLRSILGNAAIPESQMHKYGAQVAAPTAPANVQGIATAQVSGVPIPM